MSFSHSGYLPEDLHIIINYDMFCVCFLQMKFLLLETIIAQVLRKLRLKVGLVFVTSLYSD